MPAFNDVWPLFLIGGGAITAALAFERRMIRIQNRNIDESVALVNEIAPKYGVSRQMVLGIISKESSFNPNARNLTGKDGVRGGAWGLMGMTLETARGIVKDATAESLLDPRYNLTLGIAYLAKQQQRFGNDTDLVIAAYNRGPKGVEAAVRFGADLSQDPYVMYVKRVMKQLTRG